MIGWWFFKICNVLLATHNTFCFLSRFKLFKTFWNSQRYRKHLFWNEESRRVSKQSIFHKILISIGLASFYSVKGNFNIFLPKWFHSLRILYFFEPFLSFIMLPSLELLSFEANPINNLKCVNENSGILW